MGNQQIQGNQQSNHAIGWLTSPDKYLQAIRPSTGLDVLRSESKSLVRLCKEQGEVTVKALLTILISETVDYFNVGKTMSDRQIAQTIDLILQDYSVYKIDYFVLCFTRAKKGAYGKQYDRIDGQIIFEWLAEFDYEYESEIEHARVNEKKRIEKDVTVGIPVIDDPKNAPVPMPDYIKETILDMTKRKILPVKQIERTPEQLIVDGFICDFNLIIKTNDDFRGDKNYAFFHGTPGKTMDISEYIEHRIFGGDMIYVTPIKPLIKINQK